MRFRLSLSVLLFSSFRRVCIRACVQVEQQLQALSAARTVG